MSELDETRRLRRGPALHARAPERAPCGGETSTSGSELVRSAVPRLRSLAFVLAALSALFALGALLSLAGAITSPVPVHEAYVLGIVAIAFLASVAMAIVTYLPWPARRKSQVGLAFQLLGAFCIAFIEEHVARAATLSTVGVWILSFPLVPQSPRRAALSALGAALASPLSYAFHVAAGARGELVWQQAGALLAINLVCALLALFTNRVIYRLGRQVADAKHLGAYSIIEPLGSGGMGEVWRAEHRTLIRPAAIKLIRSEIAHGLDPIEVEAVRARFEREVQATALLTSPHTVAVYDYGSTEDGRLYYVMELLHGLDAETVVRRHGPLPAERVIYLLRQACESLSEAHATGLVHRDIKPANLQLCTIGGKLDFVKVLDFGLVRDVGSNVWFTADGRVSGTPAYLPPETAAHNVTDERSDIYALGCVAYYLLTGQLVFEAETAPAMMAAHLRDPVVPPSARTELPIPPELDALVVACLAKDPDARPQSMAEVRRRLDEVPLARRWGQERAAAWWRLHAPDLVSGAVAATRRAGLTGPQVPRPASALVHSRA